MIMIMWNFQRIWSLSNEMSQRNPVLTTISKRKKMCETMKCKIWLFRLLEFTFINIIFSHLGILRIHEMKPNQIKRFLSSEITYCKKTSRCDWTNIEFNDRDTYFSFPREIQLETEITPIIYGSHLRIQTFCKILTAQNVFPSYLLNFKKLFSPYSFILKRIFYWSST